MKKRILSFVLLMLMVLTSFASAAGIDYVSVEGDISFTTVSFSNDGTNVSASLKGIKAQGTDTVTLMMTLYNSKKKLVDAASDTKSIGSTGVELKATAPKPAGDFTAAATLYNSANGLSPIAVPAMSDYEGSTDLLDLSVKGVSVDGFAPQVYKYSYIVEGINTYPEIGATVREGSSKVSVSYEDKFPGKATITVENGLGTVSSVYEIEFKSLKHVVVGALSDSNFVADAGSNLNLMSSGAVSSGVGGKNLYTNLTGADDDSTDFGSRWTSDYQPLSSHHAIRKVDSVLEGWDYFVCANGGMKKDAGDYFNFEVNHHARIVVVSLAAEPSLTENGFEALPSKSYALTSFCSGASTDDVRGDLAALGINPTYADMIYYNSNAADIAAVSKYFADKYNLDAEYIKTQIPINKKVSIPTFEYKYAYSKFYEAYADEPAKVIIPAPKADHGRGYIVAVIPVGEDGELPGSGEQGGETPDEPDKPDEPVEPESDLGELISLVHGMTYSQYIDYANSTLPADKAMTKETTVSETQKLSTAHNQLSAIEEEGKLCTISAWRVFRNVTDSWKGLTFMTSDPSHYQNDSAKGWPMSMFTGRTSSFSGDSCKAEDNQIVPWWNIKVNKDMNVSIVTDKELTHLTKAEYGSWTKLTIGTDIDNPFGIYDSKNNASVGTNKYVYTKSYKAGDTVVLYNENTKNISYVPYITVFGTPDVNGGEGGDEPVVPDEPALAEGNHVIVGARYADEIVADPGVTNGFKSASAVTSAKHSKTDGVVYTNLRGNEDETAAVYGARWACDYNANANSYHEIFYVDESIEGLDYFAFKAGSDAYSGDLLKFKVTGDVEISIITSNTGMAFDGYTKAENNNGWIKGRFIHHQMAGAMRAVGVTPVYSLVKTYVPAEKDIFYNTYLKAAYEAANAGAKAIFDTNWAGFGTNVALSQNLAYKAKYSKTYTMPEGATEMEITVPGNSTGNASRDIIVVVKPLEDKEPDLSEDAEVVAVVNKIAAIGTVTLDSESAILEAREAFNALTPEKQAVVSNIAILDAAEAELAELKAAQPTPAEGDHIVVGAIYGNEFVKDADVTNGFKSAAAVTTAKSGRTNGVIYTNLRGNPDESGTVFGSRLTLMPANSASYHEIYYVDETLEGKDYFVFTAGGNAHSDATLLQFKVTADAEVSILATNASMAFEGFPLKSNSNGWVKGRFINRNMADAMNAIGVTPVYSVVKTYKPASKEDFYSTYLKAAYDSANETQKAKFDEQWTLFGTESAIGNDSAYKAMYTKTFRLPEGADEMTVTVPGNTSGASSRNIIVVVRSADEASVETDAEVVAVVEKIAAIGTVTLDSESAILEAREAFEALAPEKQAAVSNKAILEEAEAKLEELKEAAANVETVGALTSKVSGLTYAKYLDYVESVTGTKPISTSVIKDSDTIITSSIVIRESFSAGNQIGSESARRRLEAIHEDYSFLNGVKFFSPTIEWGQQADVRKWFTKLFWGQDATYSYNGFDYVVNAKTDALPTVAWWTVPVTNATVYITSHVEMPHLETAGWTKAATTAPVFTWKDTNNNNVSDGPSIVYVKEVEETTDVELPNSNTGASGTYPYFVFFVPNE